MRTAFLLLSLVLSLLLFPLLAQGKSLTNEILGSLEQSFRANLRFAFGLPNPRVYDSDLLHDEYKQPQSTATQQPTHTNAWLHCLLTNPSVDCLTTHYRLILNTKSAADQISEDLLAYPPSPLPHLAFQERPTYHLPMQFFKTIGL